MSSAIVKDAETLPAILKVGHVQRFFTISRPKAYELMHQDGFPSLRFGRAIRVPKAALLRWLDAQTGVQEG
jgi:excisionase family DNA binding protein